MCLILFFISSYHPQIIINRVELGDLLYPMYLPLLKCLSKCKGSALTQSLAEGKSYTHRLSVVIEQKVSAYVYSYSLCFISKDCLSPLRYEYSCARRSSA